LQDYKTILEKIYSPAAYFERVRSVVPVIRRADLPRKIERKQLKHDLAGLGRLMWRVTVRLPQMRYQFWKTVFASARRNPSALEYVWIMTAFYLHLGPFSRFVIDELDRRLTMIDGGGWADPVLLPAKAASKSEHEAPAAAMAKRPVFV
jgi:hypothetical protein